MVKKYHAIKLNFLQFSMGIIKSYLKYRGLKKHSKKLAPSKKNFEKTLSNLGQGNSDLDNFLDFCMDDENVQLTLDQFEASKDTLEELYQKLLHFGAGQWAGKYYVATASLFYGYTLYFLLEDNNIHFRDKCSLLIEYFERNDSGPVPHSFRGPLPNDPLKPLYDMEQELENDKNA